MAHDETRGGATGDDGTGSDGTGGDGTGGDGTGSDGTGGDRTGIDRGRDLPQRVLRMPTGEVVHVLSSGADTAGAEFSFEAVLPPRLSGPPPHRHRLETEAFTVLEGRLRVRVGAERRDLEAGETVVVPPGTVHAFSNVTDRPVRVAVRETPAGSLEDQFAVLVTAGRVPPLRLLARVNVAHELSLSLHGMPDVVQRPLWRLLARLPAPRRSDGMPGMGPATRG